MSEKNIKIFGETYLERVENAIEHIKSGKGILLVDDEDRENEGDIIFSAQLMKEKDMALMIRECSGIVCLCITQAKADSLNLPSMVDVNTSKNKTAFTVSIEAKKGVTTGVSAADRITTIQAAIAYNAAPDDLARPGHVFPLIAKEGGVFTRRGHTEGSVDLMSLAGLAPASVLCELTNENGTMARLPQIIDFAAAHDMTVVTIEDICTYKANK